MIFCIISSGLADADVGKFKSYLHTIWMGLYDRGGGFESSSGFEHVFLGELDGNKIQGFHSWIRFYLEEKKGNLNYLGFINHIKLGKVQVYNSINLNNYKITIKRL